MLTDMEKVFNPQTNTYAKTPGVIFLDDAQFAHVDAALPAFIERLMHTAVMQRWPVLILITHWKSGLPPETMLNERSFTRILGCAFKGSAIDNSAAAGLPGGYLTDEHFSEIDLNPIADLSGALREKLPSLTKEQSAAILERMGGNPRYLEQMIAYLMENLEHFKDSEPSEPLTPEGFKEALAATQSRDIFELVLERLHKAPIDVQEAVCLASLQGVRFVSDLVDAVAPSRIGHTVYESLEKAEDSYGMLIGTKAVAEQSLGQFPERLFYEVAQRGRRSLKSLGGEPAIQTMFKETIAARIDDPDYPKSASSEALALVYGIAANLFEHSSAPKERNIAQRSLGELARLELSRYSFESAAAVYERLLAIEPYSGSASELTSRIKTWDVLATIYRNLNWPAKSARASRKGFGETVQGIPDGFDIFLRATGRDAVRQQFNHWKQEHPDWPPESYLLVAHMIVPPLLQLSELARSRPDLVIKKGDDPLGDTPFLVFSERVLENGSEADVGSPIPEHLVQALFLQEHAYALDDILGEGHVEKEHLELLESLARNADRDDDLPAAESFLLRALQISQGLDNELDQIATLSNLGMIAGKQENSDASERYLQQARGLIEAIFAEDTFHVDLMVDEEGADRDTVKSRKVANIAVPVRFSTAYDEDSDAVLHKVWTLKQFAANIYGNLATNAQQNKNLAAAKEGFLHSLRIREEINDKEGMTTDLRNLGKVAHIEGDLTLACSYWGECVKVFRELERRDAGQLLERGWTTAIEEMLKGMRASGCGE